jgi:hypothetical protein
MLLEKLARRGMMDDRMSPNEAMPPAPPPAAKTADDNPPSPSAPSNGATEGDACGAAGMEVVAFLMNWVELRTSMAGEESGRA